MTTFLLESPIHFLLSSSHLSSHSPMRSHDHISKLLYTYFFCCFSFKTFFILSSVHHQVFSWKKIVHCFFLFICCLFHYFFLQSNNIILKACIDKEMFLEKKKLLHYKKKYWGIKRHYSLTKSICITGKFFNILIW